MLGSGYGCGEMVGGEWRAWRGKGEGEGRGKGGTAYVFHDDLEIVRFLPRAPFTVCTAVFGV